MKNRGRLIDARIEGCCDRSLGGKAFGDEWLVRRRFRDIRRRRGPFFGDLGEQPSLNRGLRPLLLRMIVGKGGGP